MSPRDACKRPGHRRDGLDRDTRGGSAVQYVILVGCVALLALIAFRNFGDALVHATHFEGERVRTLTPDCQGSGDCAGGATTGTGQPVSAPPQGGGVATGAGGIPATGTAGAGTGGPQGAGGHALALVAPAAGGQPGASGPAAGGGGGQNGSAGAVGTGAPGGPPGSGTGGSGTGAGRPSAGAASINASNGSRSGSLGERCLGSNLCAGTVGAALGFVQGAAPMGFLTNLLPQPESVKNNAAYQYWNGAGQIAGGLAAATTGVGSEVVGGVLDATGVGAIAGVPINAAGAVVIASGIASVSSGAAQMAKAGQILQMQSNQEGGGPKPGDAKPTEPASDATGNAETPQPGQTPGANAVKDPAQFGRDLGGEVKSLRTGKRAAIAKGVSDANLPQADAAKATAEASKVAFGRIAEVPIANGDKVIASVQAGPGQPIFVVKPNGNVIMARATIEPTLPLNIDRPITITNITPE